MKTKLIFLFLCISTACCYSQGYTKFRINGKQEAGLLKIGNTDILMIEILLNENEKNISANYPSLSDPSNFIESAKKKAALNPKLYKDICIDCYVSEYQLQKDKVYDISKEQIAIRNRESEEREKVFKSETQKRDSIAKNKTNYSKEKPYDRFLFAMDMLGEKNGIRYGNFTIFTNMDEELARTRFSLYLQDNGFTYGSDSKQINKPNFIQEYYVPKIAVNEEANNYIEIKYFYSVRNDLPSYYTTILDENYPCWIIDKVVIDGTADLVINLYVKYWLQSRKTIGGNKTGEIAYNIFMGDRVSLQYISKNKCRIEITKQGDSGFDYYSSYKILEVYNDSKKN